MVIIDQVLQVFGDCKTERRESEGDILQENTILESH